MNVTIHPGDLADLLGRPEVDKGVMAIVKRDGDYVRITPVASSNRFGNEADE